MVAESKDEWTPDGKMLDGVGSAHTGSHSQKYRDAVNARILRLANEDFHIIRNELQKIAQELTDGTCPWP
jgi:hypothetical protein